MNARPIDAFADAMLAAGVGLPKAGIQADGVLHRFRGADDKPGRLNAWYVLHLDGWPAGAFGCWREGFTRTWRADKPEASAADLELMRQAQRRARQAAEQERQRMQAEAASHARRLWESASAANPGHAYLIAKQVQAHGLRQSGGLLLVPLTDPDGELWNVQTIAPDGAKRFQRHGRVTGLAARMGAFPPHDGLLICEGWATAATLHQESGLPVLAAMNCGNLKAVALAARNAWPDTAITICGDDDRFTEDNPGRTKANVAAAAIGAKVAFPAFSDDEPGTDFNDLALARQGVAA